MLRYIIGYTIIFDAQPLRSCSQTPEMYKITYKLRTAAINKKTGEAPVSLVYRTQNPKSEFVKATGESCKPEWLDTGKGKVKRSDLRAAEKNARIAELTHEVELVARRVFSEYGTYNAQRVSYWVEELRSFDEAVDAAMPELDAQTSVDIDIVKQRIRHLEQELQAERDVLKALLFVRDGHEEETPTDLFTARITELMARRGVRLKPATRRNYGTLINLVAAFNSRLDFMTVKLTTLNDFQNWLIHHKRYKNQSVNNYLTKFKAVIKEFADELDINIAYFAKFKPLPDLANENIIVLTAEEIQEIEALDVRKYKVMAAVLDQFLFCHETGLRHSDINKVGRGAIEDMPDGDGRLVGKKLLRIQTQKGSKQIIVPLTDKALAILARNNHSFPNYTVSSYNQALTSICRRCKTLAHDFTRTHYIGNEAVQETKPKAEFVQSHAARRSFINNALFRGVSESTCATWVGHSDVKMIQQHYRQHETQALAEAHKIL